MVIPSTLPVMALPGYAMLPHSLLPLNIFESRYREMLCLALQSERMFCIVMRKGEEPPAGILDEVYPEGTAGLVRACVEQQDGTSKLILQGLQRVRFTGWQQTLPFRIARIKVLTDTGATSPEVGELTARITSLTNELSDRGITDMDQPLKSQLEGTDDPAAYADMVAHNLINDPLERQKLVAMSDVVERLLFLTRHLELMINTN